VLGYCVAHELWAGAIGSGIGFIAAVGAAIAFRTSVAATCPPIGPIGGPYGNGPYRKANCEPNAKVVTVLADIAAKIRDLPEDDAGDRSIDWQAFDTARAEAQAANDRSDYVSAIQHYSAAIRRMMKQLRQSRPTVEADRI
jgi:hypothetical protein